MITTLSLTLNTLTVILDNGARIEPVRSDNPKWKEIIELVKQFDLDATGKMVGPEDKLLELLSLKSIVENYSVGQLSVNSTGVTFRGQPLHSVDSDRVMAFLREGLPYKPIANYMARKMANPSARAISELYSFLEHKNMPITPEGKIIAYKGVRTDYYSVMGNTSTVVLKGEVDSSGHILNSIGAEIEVERSSVDDNFKNHCSFGLHAGSLQYATGWGKRAVLVEIDPADVVSVPDDCNCQKLRCCKYKVIGEYTGAMPNTFTNEFSSSDDGEPDVCHGCGNHEDDCDCECDGCGNHEDDCTCDTATPIDTTDTAVDPAIVNAVNAKCIFTKEVREIIVELMGLSSELPEDFALSTIGMDELDEVELTVELSDKYQFDFNDDALETIYKTKNLSDLVEHIYTQLNPAPEVVDPLKEKYDEGQQVGYYDCQEMKPPTFLAGDENGADSEAHAAYIRGYVNGYTS